MENMQEVNNRIDRDKKHSKDLKVMENVNKMKGKVPTPLKVMALRAGTLATFMAHPPFARQGAALKANLNKFKNCRQDKFPDEFCLLLS